MIGCSLEVGDSSLLVRWQTSHAKNPAHRGGHASDDVLAEASGQQCVVAVMADRKQLLPRNSSLLREMQGCQIALFDECRVVGLQARRQGQGKKCIAIFGVFSQSSMGKILGAADRGHEVP